MKPSKIFESIELAILRARDKLPPSDRRAFNQLADEFARLLREAEEREKESL